MPIYLRYRLRWLSNQRLAAELEDVLGRFEELNADEPKNWLERLSMGFTPSRMKRPFIRHRWAYWAKAALFASLASGEVWFLPFLPLYLWVLGKRNREAMLKPFSLFVAKCELEDLLDETERRLRRRNGGAAVR